MWFLFTVLWYQGVVNTAAILMLCSFDKVDDDGDCDDVLNQ